jgi:cytochrome P450 family 138
VTTTRSVLPKGPRAPALVQGAAHLAMRDRFLRRVRDSHGSAFTVRMPRFGPMVVLSDPAEVRALFTNNQLFGNVQPNPLGRVIGPGSTFSLDGDEHRKRRKLLVPPFNGRRLEVYKELIEEEAEREMATWPQGRPFPVMESMMRMTARIILRTVFGAEGKDLERLRVLLPAVIRTGSRLTFLPIPRWNLFGLGPWPRFREMRERTDAILFELIARAKVDPNLESRDDILAAMVRARYDDGSPMADQDIADELSTLLAAGHETTATTLAWAVERLSRHPAVLARLVEEADAGGTDLRDATIWEIQRTRPVIDLIARNVIAEQAELGRWVFPKGHKIAVSMLLMHTDPQLYPDPERFSPDRFLGQRPDLYTWIPFGGGVRRCIGASFAHLEMNIVLRVMLRDFELAPTTDPDARWSSSGLAAAPSDGGKAVLRRRIRPAEPTAEAPATAATGQCPVTGHGASSVAPLAPGTDAA